MAAEPHGRFTYYRLEPSALERLNDQLGAVAHSARRTADRRRPCS